LKQRGFWAMLAVAGTCALPIVAWNAGHDWVSVRHVLGHAGFQSEPGIYWLGPLTYVGKQLGFLLGYWFVVWLLAMSANRPWGQPQAGQEEDRQGIGYLWWMSALVFVVFGLFSFKNGGGEPNWPAAAYLSGMVLAGAWLSLQLRSPRTRYR